MSHRIEVVSITTGTVVKTIPVPSGWSERSVEKAMTGLLRNLDRDAYFVREVTS